MVAVIREEPVGERLEKRETFKMGKCGDKHITAIGLQLIEFFHFFRDLIENYRFDSGFFVKIGGGDKSVTNFCSILCVFGGV